MRRLPLLLVLAAVFILLPLGGEAVRLYTDWLWFHEVGYPNVFGKVLDDQAAPRSGGRRGRLRPPLRESAPDGPRARA